MCSTQSDIKTEKESIIFFNYSQTEPFSPSVPPFDITDCSITDSTRKKFSKGLTSEAIIIWEAIYESDSMLPHGIFYHVISTTSNIYILQA